MLFIKTSLLISPFFVYLSILLLIWHTKAEKEWHKLEFLPWSTTEKPTEECLTLGANCPHHTHTLCKYKGIGPKCDYVGDGGVTDEEKKEIVGLHNKLRSLVASGNEMRGDPGPQPAATNMLRMYWDDNLAKVAQRWADQCTDAHDTCRTDPRGRVMQNTFWRTDFPRHEVNWTLAIMTWYNEVDLFDKDIVKSYWGDYRTSHYTQIVWGDTNLVGCGRRDYGNPNYEGHYHPINKMYVCNYLPAGDRLREPMYDIDGPTCSKCPTGTHCVNNLCEPLPPN